MKEQKKTMQPKHKAKVRNQHEGKTQTPQDIENNKSDLGGSFDKEQDNGAAPGTSTADETEERDSDNPTGR